MIHDYYQVFRFSCLNWTRLRAWYIWLILLPLQWLGPGQDLGPVQTFKLKNWWSNNQTVVATLWFKQYCSSEEFGLNMIKVFPMRKNIWLKFHAHTCILVSILGGIEVLNLKHGLNCQINLFGWVILQLHKCWQSYNSWCSRCWN